uniref:Uncharacterized protein n=1 Tax=Archaeoglobus fulgidus TaxID=2234 RepID=A0A7J3M122_ARCFL
MNFLLREEIAKKLKKRFRVISPFKVGIGWVDIAILGKELVGIDFCESYESSVERLNSFPFHEKIIVGNCEDCERLDEFCKSFDIETPEFVPFESSLSLKRLEDRIASLYIAKEVLDDGSYEDLKILGFASSYSRHKIEPKFFVTLTRDGFSIAKKIIYSRLLAKEKELRKLANPLNYLIALGVSNSLSLKPENFESANDLKSLLFICKKVPLSAFITSSQNPKVAFCEFLSKAVLNEKAVALAEKLMGFGLAVKNRLYSPSGEFIWEEYRFAREVIEFLIKSSFYRIEDEILNDFISLVSAIQKRAEVIEGESLRRAREIGVLHNEKSFEDFARIRVAMLVEKALERLEA